MCHCVGAAYEEVGGTNLGRREMAGAMDIALDWHNLETKRPWGALASSDLTGHGKVLSTIVRATCVEECRLWRTSIWVPQRARVQGRTCPLGALPLAEGEGVRSTVLT